MRSFSVLMHVIEEKCSFTTKEGPWNGVGKSKAMTHEIPLHIFPYIQSHIRTRKSEGQRNKEFETSVGFTR